MHTAVPDLWTHGFRPLGLLMQAVHAAVLLLRVRGTPSGKSCWLRTLPWPFELGLPLTTHDSVLTTNYY